MPYNPQGNGACEHRNLTLLQMLQALEKRKKEKWPDYIPKLVWAYNNTRYSPFLLMVKKNGRCPLRMMMVPAIESKNGHLKQKWAATREKYDLVAQRLSPCTLTVICKLKEILLQVGDQIMSGWRPDNVAQSYVTYW